MAIERVSSTILQGAQVAVQRFDTDAVLGIKREGVFSGGRENTVFTRGLNLLADYGFPTELRLGDREMYAIDQLKLNDNMAVSVRGMLPLAFADESRRLATLELGVVHSVPETAQRPRRTRETTVRLIGRFYPDGKAVIDEPALLSLNRKIVAPFSPYIGYTDNILTFVEEALA